MYCEEKRELCQGGSAVILVNFNVAYGIPVIEPGVGEVFFFNGFEEAEIQIVVNKNSRKVSMRNISLTIKRKEIKKKY